MYSCNWNRRRSEEVQTSRFNLFSNLFFPFSTNVHQSLYNNCSWWIYCDYAFTRRFLILSLFLRLWLAHGDTHEYGKLGCIFCNDKIASRKDLHGRGLNLWWTRKIPVACDYRVFLQARIFSGSFIWPFFFVANLVTRELVVWLNNS